MNTITITNKFINHACGAYEGDCTCHVLTTLRGKTTDNTPYIWVTYTTTLKVGDVVPLTQDWDIED